MLCSQFGRTNVTWRPALQYLHLHLPWFPICCLVPVTSPCATKAASGLRHPSFLESHADPISTFKETPSACAGSLGDEFRASGCHFLDTVLNCLMRRALARSAR